MIEKRAFDTLGHANHGWLDAHHHFSFADYHDPTRQGVGPLLVWNDDTIQPDSGFPMHPHRDMEIITYVRAGQIDHEDHLGNRGTTLAGDVQVMSAGTGIMHAEFNRGTAPTQIFQIWIQPKERGMPPRWDNKEFPKGANANRLVPLASGRDADIEAGGLYIHQDAAVHGATLEAGKTLEHTLAGSRAYLVPARGRLRINGTEVDARDGLVLSGETALRIEALEDAEFILADLP
ncbi:MAG: pirin family protein [Pseudomonadota bacterium]